MPRWLQADFQVITAVPRNGVPFSVSKRRQLPGQDIEELLYLAPIFCEAALQGIFQHGGQKQGRSLTAEDRSFVAGGQQVRKPTDMIDVDMSENQAAEMIDGKVDL